MAWRSWPPAKWLHTKQACQRVRDTWEDAGPMCAWLDEHVGPSDLPPEDRRW